MQKVLITGITGFVGTNLLDYLNNKVGYQITGFNRELGKNNDIHIDHDVVIHLAGKAHDLRKGVDEQEYFDANYGLTKRLYDAFLKSDIAKSFIFISSVKAFADTVSDVLTEDMAPEPVTAYGRSKLKAEEYIRSQTLPEGKSYYILRPCMIYGPGNKGNLNLLYSIVKKGIPYPLGAFENKRSFLSVENLCYVMYEIIEGHVSGGIYNIADDDPLSTNDLISLMSQALGKKPRLWAIPCPIIKLMAKTGDLAHLPLNTERLDKMTENYVVSNTKLKKALGKELPVNVREGLIKTFKSFNN